MRRALKLLLPLLLLQVSCSRQKTITTDELRSELTSAVSLAAETETIIDYVAQHRLTHNYALGHLGYLAREAQRSAKELDEASPEPATEQKLAESKEQVASLSKEIAAARASMGNPEALAATKQEIAHTRAAIEKVKASL